MATSYAQTNLQLHAQLLDLGYSIENQEYVAAAYRLAVDLFSGQYRGSGKPFVAHLVGTASILSATKASAPVIAAGLLHAAYDQGDFGLGLLGRHSDKRRELSSVLGTEAEGYVQRYFELRWTETAIADLVAGVDAMPPIEQRVVLIRVANELEDYLDVGILFCANSDARLSRLTRIADHHITLARRLRQPALADELARAFDANLAGSVPDGVRGPSGHSRVRTPRSFRRKYIASLRAYLARH